MTTTFDAARRRLLRAAVGLVCAPALAMGEAVPAADARRVRAVIEAQLAAFRADDAARAYSFATPALRAQFGSAERFMAMVREAYAVVYRPASVAFLAPERAGEEVLQGVQMTDADGRAWLAVYRLQRQPDRAWRIGGCSLQPRAGVAT